MGAGWPPELAPPVAARRVLLVSQPTTGGVAVVVADLARAAKRSGREVTVACPRSGQLAGWAAEAGAAWSELALTRSPGPGDARHVLRLRRLVALVDVVHLHSSKAGAVGRLALASLPARRRPTTVFTPHGWSWLSATRLAPAYRAFESVMATTADAVVAVSEEEEALGIAALGRRSARRLRVIPNGVDLARFTPEGPPAARGAEPLIVCVGRLSQQKGQDLAVRALARMATPGARLRLVGPGEARDRDRIISLAAELGVAPRVELSGPTTEPEAQFRAADAVVVPSRWDGLSLSLLEAMACGAAVVACAVAGTAVLGGGAGVVVPPEDPGALASALDAVLADPYWRTSLGTAARARVEEKASLDVSMQANLALWESLATERVRGAR